MQSMRCLSVRLSVPLEGCPTPKNLVHQITEQWWLPGITKDYQGLLTDYQELPMDYQGLNKKITWDYREITNYN